MELPPALNHKIGGVPVWVYAGGAAAALVVSLLTKKRSSGPQQTVTPTAASDQGGNQPPFLGDTGGYGGFGGNLTGDLGGGGSGGGTPPPAPPPSPPPATGARPYPYDYLSSLEAANTRGQNTALINQIEVQYGLQVAGPSLPPWTHTAATVPPGTQ